MQKAAEVCFGNFTIIFVTIFENARKEGFFPVIKFIFVLCSSPGKNIKTKNLQDGTSQRNSFVAIEIQAYTTEFKSIKY